MSVRYRFGRNVCILLAGLLISGCASVQRAILEASMAQGDVTGTVPEAQDSTANALGSANANTESNPAAEQSPAPQPAARPAIVSETPARDTNCNRAKAISVGMTVAQVYRSCWGRPKSVNTSVMGSTKTEMLLYEGYNYIYAENGIVKSIETSNR